jgi:HSP20 family protein
VFAVPAAESLYNTEVKMALTKYPVRRPAPSLWADLESNRLSRIFDDALFGDGAAQGWVPPVSISESQDELMLTAEVPGLSLDEITLKVENSVLTMSGEKIRSDTADEGEGMRYHVAERSYGSFKRSFTLPRSVDSEKITARLENGVLEVLLPKSVEAKGRTIEISG